MDILAHTLWTSALGKEANRQAEKKNKKFKINIGWTAFWGVFPDLFAFTLPFILFFYNFIAPGFVFNFDRSNIAGFELAPKLYQYSHSLIIFALVFLVTWLIYRRPRYELLGWALHILIDIPSHSIEFYPTPFLFPLSEYRFPYGISWADKWFMIVNYSLLLVVWGGGLYKKIFNGRFK